MPRWTVEGQAVAAHAIGPPPTAYGQHHRWAAYPRLRYAVRITRDELERRLDALFEEISQTEREEIAAGLDVVEIDAIARYRDAGMPTLAEMLDGAHEIFGELIKFFDLDVLQALAAPSASEGTYYVVASVDRCVVVDGVAELSGVAYSVPVRRS